MKKLAKPKKFITAVIICIMILATLLISVILADYIYVDPFSPGTEITEDQKVLFNYSISSGPVAASGLRQITLNLIVQNMELRRTCIFTKVGRQCCSAIYISWSN